MLHKITTRAQVAHITVSWLPFSALDWLLPARTRDLVCSLSIPLSFALAATFLWSGVCVYVACGNMKRKFTPVPTFILCCGVCAGQVCRGAWSTVFVVVVRRVCAVKTYLNRMCVCMCVW